MLDSDLFETSRCAIRLSSSVVGFCREAEGDGFWDRWVVEPRGDEVGDAMDNGSHESESEWVTRRIFQFRRPPLSRPCKYVNRTVSIG